MLVVLVTLKISLQLSQHSSYLIFQTIRTIFVLCSGLQLDDEILRLSKHIKSQNHYSWERPLRSSGLTISQPPVSPTKNHIPEMLLRVGICCFFLWNQS